MSLFKSADEHGVHILNELEEHVMNFHEGLANLEQRLLRRRDVVKARMAELEDESADIHDGLRDITRHRS